MNRFLSGREFIVVKFLSCFLGSLKNIYSVFVESKHDFSAFCVFKALLAVFAPSEHFCDFCTVKALFDHSESRLSLFEHF